MSRDALSVLREWWLGHKGDADMPPRSALQPRDLLPILPSIVLVDVGPGRGLDDHRFTFRLTGTGVDTVLGGSLKGRSVDDVLFGCDARSIQDDYETVVRERRPLRSHHRLVFAEDRFVEYRRLAVPLSDPSGAAVTTLACAAELICSYRINPGRPANCPGPQHCAIKPCQEMPPLALFEVS